MNLIKFNFHLSLLIFYRFWVINSDESDDKSVCVCLRFPIYLGDIKTVLLEFSLGLKQNEQERERKEGNWSKGKLRQSV